MKKLFPLIIIIGLLISCRKNEVTAPDFNVTIAKDTFKVGDTVTFNFTGNATYVSFFSDEPKRQYLYRQRTMLQGKCYIQFYSFKDTSSLQTDTLQLFVSKSKNIIGNNKILDTTAWVDISNRAVLATGPDTTYSGMIDVSDLLAADTTFFAFRKRQPKSITRVIRWTITNFSMGFQQPDSTLYPVISMKNAGWSVYNVQTSSLFRWTILPNTSDPTALISATTGAVINNQQTDCWVLARASFPFTVNPDTGVPVQYLTTYVYPTFSYVYKTAGIYTATFLGVNANIHDSKETVRTVKVTIID